MKDYFNFDLPFKFLFKSWDVNSNILLVATCFFVALLSIFLESLKNLKSRFSEHFYSLPLVKSELEGKEEQGKTSDLVITDSLKYVKSQRIKNHTADSLIHMSRVTCGYLLMLGVMTYNTYVLASTVLGSVFGYFLFCYASAESVQVNERFRPRTEKDLSCPHNTNTVHVDSTERLISHA